MSPENIIRLFVLGAVFVVGPIMWFAMGENTYHA